MFRKIAMTGAAVALALGGVAAFAGPASAAKPFLGDAALSSATVSCTTTGKVKISPPLTNINTVPSTVTAKTKSTSCSGSVAGPGGPFTMSKAKGLTTSVGTEPGTCSGLLEAGETPFTTVISWKANGAKLNGSNITFANNGPSGLGFDLPSNGAAGKGTTIITGSFAGEPAWAHADVDSAPIITALTTPGGCDPNEKGKAKGIKKITITGGHITIG